MLLQAGFFVFLLATWTAFGSGIALEVKAERDAHSSFLEIVPIVAIVAWAIAAVIDHMRTDHLGVALIGAIHVVIAISAVGTYTRAARLLARRTPAAARIVRR